MLNFVNNGTDDAILKSLPIENCSEDLVKAMSKQGLVQKDVTVQGKNGKTFTRKQWVKASDAQSGQNVVNKKTSDDSKDKSVTSVSAQSLSNFSAKEVREKLNDMPPGTKITGIRNKSGKYDFDTVVEKQEGYVANYAVGAKSKETWWAVSGEKRSEFDVADIILGKSKYYGIHSSQNVNVPKSLKDYYGINGTETIQELKQIRHKAYEEMSKTFKQYQSAVKANRSDAQTLGTSANGKQMFLAKLDTYIKSKESTQINNNVSSNGLISKISGIPKFNEVKYKNSSSSSSKETFEFTDAKGHLVSGETIEPKEVKSGDTVLLYNGMNIMAVGEVKKLEKVVVDSHSIHARYDTEITVIDAEGNTVSGFAGSSVAKVTKVIDGTAQVAQKSTRKSNKLSKEDAKKKTQSYTSKVEKTDVERKSFMDKVKSHGITWKEDAHVGINWMRCCMAMNKHFAEGGNFDPDSMEDKDNSGGGANDKKKVRSYKKFGSSEEKSIGEVSYDSGFGKSPEGIMEMLGIYDINSSDDVIWDKYDKAISKIKDNYKDCKDWYDSVDKYMWEESGNKYYKGKLDTNDGIWNIKKADKAVRQAIKDDFDAKYARGIKIDEKKVKSLGAGYYRLEVDTQTYTSYYGDKRKGVTVDIQFTDTGDIEYSEVVQ